MKYTIEGFSQQFAMTLKKNIEKRGKIIEIKIDCTDLVILRWFVDFYPNMRKMVVDKKEYAWLTHKKLLEDLPLIDISKDSFIARMQKLVEFNILEYKFLKENGSFSLYGFGENYYNLIDNKGICLNMDGVGVQTGTGVSVQTSTKNNSIKDMSFKDNFKENTQKKFEPPTFEEVKAYAEEKGFAHLAQKFFDYFTTGNWTDSKGQKVKNWKQKFITWSSYNTSDPKPPKHTEAEIAKYNR